MKWFYSKRCGKVTGRMFSDWIYKAFLFLHKTRVGVLSLQGSSIGCRIHADSMSIDFSLHQRPILSPELSLTEKYFNNQLMHMIFSKWSICYLYNNLWYIIQWRQLIQTLKMKLSSIIQTQYIAKTCISITEIGIYLLEICWFNK